MPSWSASDFVSQPQPDPPEPPKPPEKKKSAPKPAAVAPPAAAPKPAAAVTPAPAPVAPSPAPVPAPAPAAPLVFSQPSLSRTVPPPKGSQPLVSACENCGYIHQGKPLLRCPDCSGSMHTGAADLLKFTAPGWSRSTATALNLAALAVAVHIVAAVLRFESLRVAAVGHAVAAVLLAAAVFVATRKEPNPRTPRADSAMLARIASIVAALGWLLVLYLVLTRAPWRGTIKPAILFTLMTDATMAVAFGFYTHHLAGRLPDDSLSANALQNGWTAGLVCVLLCAVHFFEVVTRVHMMMFFCSFPLIAFCGAFLLWGKLTLTRLAIGLRHAAREADRVEIRRRAAMFNNEAM